MSIRIGLCCFFLFFFFCSVFGFWSVLFCWAGRVGRDGWGWKRGRDGWGWKVKLYTIGKMGGWGCNLEEEGEEQQQTDKTDKKNT